MKKIVLYLFATIGLISLLFALYSLLFSISGSTMYGSSESVGAIPGSINQSAQYSTLQQAPSSTGTPVAFAELNNNPSAPALATQETMKRMIIRNANLTLEVVDISQAMNKISNLANTSGGYVVSSNSNQNDQVGIYNSAQISIRIPAEGFKKAIDQLKTFAIKVNNENSTGEDITQRYVDLQSTLNNLETNV